MRNSCRILFGDLKARDHIGDKAKKVSVLELQSSGTGQTAIALSCEHHDKTSVYDQLLKGSPTNTI
jgi:AAA+ superfamily predicted ATPase